MIYSCLLKDSKMNKHVRSKEKRVSCYSYITYHVNQHTVYISESINDSPGKWTDKMTDGKRHTFVLGYAIAQLNSQILNKKRKTEITKKLNNTNHKNI